MANRMVHVRVRPPRVAVLVAVSSGVEGFRTAVGFLSQLWGGRFASIIASDATLNDTAVTFLKRSRPEFVYTVGEIDPKLEDKIRATCQPRGYLQLTLESSQPLARMPGHENFYSIDYALNELRRNPDMRPGMQSQIVTVTAAPDSPWAIYCEAVFGRHYTPKKGYRDLDIPFEGATAGAFIELVSQFDRDGHSSWLDVGSLGLSTNFPGLSYFCNWVPTIVVVSDPAIDLSLFWNLRAATNWFEPCIVLPIPADACAHPAVIQIACNWLAACPRRFQGQKIVNVRSASVPAEELYAIARRIQESFNTGSDLIVRVDRGYANFNTVPVEYETTLPLTVRRRTLTFLPPAPRIFGALGSDCTWMLDLLKDVGTGRSVGDVCLPSTAVAADLVNVPPAPYIRGYTHIEQFGDGRDGITVRCTSPDKVVRLRLPSATELIEETFRANGFEPTFDEKRAAYRAALKLFGGLYPASKAFAGKSGALLNCLAGDPVTLNQIQSACKTGNGSILESSSRELRNAVLKIHSDRTGRVTHSRFLARGSRGEPDGQTLPELLNYWVKRGVVRRFWRIECKRCHKQSDFPKIDLRKSVMCPQCGAELALPGFVPVSYSLSPTVRAARGQGVGPVVMTGQVLYSLTRSGFQWLPGVKYESGSTGGDIDIAAVCDGHLVFAECKSLADVGQDAGCWGDVTEQFVETAKVAKSCGASLAVLASLAESYPASLETRVRAAVGVPVALWRQSDLFRGRLKSGDEGTIGSVTINEVIADSRSG